MRSDNALSTISIVVMTALRPVRVPAALPVLFKPFGLGDRNGSENVLVRRQYCIMNPAHGPCIQTSPVSTSRGRASPRGELGSSDARRYGARARRSFRTVATT
jgi:hypothetical protein